ncbi:DUF3857 domain-containing protein [Sphingobacterium haloxyli]|uniref:Transglutaminase-like domain-containing protein n=1 Tax=Sphingobacterium haloxyli TaxID=2100533 RepID=A0A2S9J4Z8_9SPHI|nr:DUF3857 domain-containing protein [Sphingobacterium haloxyli]PRD47830.1 hypothetical protein C5745_07905 [Sphingobacterium haloxyli]
MMHRLFALILIYHVCFFNTHAQTNELPPITFRDFNIPDSPFIDSASHAVVIIEKGRSDIQVDEGERELRVLHRYGIRIKILNKEGFDRANYVIPLYKIGNKFETVSHIRGYTHYIDGKIHTVEMEKGAVFHEKVNDFVNLSKFTLPNITENCIIDIEYEIRSPDIFNYRTWKYQDDIPKLYSEYTAIIPAVYNYNVTLTGFYKLTDQKSRLLKDHFLLNGRRFDSSQLTYIMKDIPAFHEESYMLAPKNYKSAINFELMQYYLTNGGREDLTKEWKDVDRELLSNRSFGGQINRENNFKRILPEIYAEDDSEEDKARKIYSYIKRQIKWNKVYGKYSQFGVKEALEKRNGNIGDINLALISACSAAGIEAYPVLVSTRENGLPNTIHPVISDFNYLVVQVRVHGKSYFLDASEENLPFGLLPLRCINGNGRIIYSKKSSEWIKLENEIQAFTHFDIAGKIDDIGQFKGEIRIIYEGLDALNRRNYIRGFSSLDAYIEERMNNSASIKIEEGTVYQLDSLDKNLVESYEISMDFSDNLRGSNFVFNPILINRMTKNPFNLEERNYPVDLGSRQKELYTISVQLPEGFHVERQPKNTGLALPEAAARYTYQSHYGAGTLILKQELSLNKAIYEVDEYFHLKEFYSRIIQHQKVDFAFTKK